MEIDENQIELELEKENKSVALVANIPVVRVKRNCRGVKVGPDKAK
jgi:cell division topological specificity factor